jgi:four helix bundle protein
MTTIKTLEDINAWAEAREVTREIYDITKRGAFAKDFELRGQIRRAAISIMSNIAEGYECQARGAFGRYLGIAKGSAGELRTQLYVALDQCYITKEEFAVLTDRIRKIASQISRLRSYIMTHPAPNVPQPAAGPP